MVDRATFLLLFEIVSIHDNKRSEGKCSLSQPHKAGTSLGGCLGATTPSHDYALRSQKERCVQSCSSWGLLFVWSLYTLTVSSYFYHLLDTRNVNIYAQHCISSFKKVEDR